MKRAILFLAALTSVYASSTPPTAKEIPGFVYVREAKKFVGEDSKQLSADGRRALTVARAVLAFHLKAEVEGKFSIAEEAWGYQVNFYALKTKKDGVWVEEREGFGEVFLSKSMDRIKVDYGP